MIYTTSGEFIQALKDYDKIKDKAEEWKQKYKDLYYLRYEKIRSPLDYDVVGYKKKNGEMVQIRQIKSGGSFNQEAIAIAHEQLERDMEYALNEHSKLIVKLENTRTELKKIDDPLKTILIMRYLEHKKLKEVCKKSDLYLNESGMTKYIQRELNKYYW